MPILAAVLWALLALLSVPAVVLAVECVSALWPRRRAVDCPLQGRQPRVAVLVPAHNEELGLANTLCTLLRQARAGDRVVVVADNCTDATAEVARRAGAEVIERWDPNQRGKGYALDYGLRYLDADPPDVVAIVDADCTVHEDAIVHIAQRAFARGRPTQALYLMERPAHPHPKDAVSALAFLVKNLVRPYGLSRLNMPCLLTGTGMAFPWQLIRKAPLASGNIVEDMQLGIDLALGGTSPTFCKDALVVGRLPQHAAAAVSQRTRWEHGHLQTMLVQAPRLAWAGLRQRRLELLGLAAELSVPPLSLLILLWLAASAVATAYAIAFDDWRLAIASAVALVSMGTVVAAAWWRFGRFLLPLSSLLAAPFYVLWKVPIYIGFLLKRQKAWVRTQRDATPATPR